MTATRIRILLVTLGLLLLVTVPPLGAGVAGAAQQPFVTAHRGASAYAPENTLAAVRLGVRMDADMVEVDVQRTKDGELVVMHDTTLARTTDVEHIFPDRAPWRIRDFTLAEIEKLDAGGWKSPKYDGEPVPTLAQVLDVLADAEVGLMLEAKNPAQYPGIGPDILAELTADPYWRAATDPSQLLLVSFDWRFQRGLHLLAPEYPVGVIGTPARGELDDLADWADFVNVPHTELDRGLANRIHAAGLSTAPWTVNRRADMRRMIRTGADGITTNRPDVLRSFL
ncbi:MAG: glycerophosphodiester phosphodiesterase [Streptosporangiales bacterium]|nr:glycerophosphodiester phosphodiesterase [Streptosporangiales bacterium]